MDLNHVRLFVEVVDRGTFTAAATALGLPKSSVSRGVAALEAQLGVTLLHRTTRRVTLTDAGRDYADHARNALHELDEAGDRVGSAADEAHGLVRMTAPPDLSGGGMIAQILARFLLAHPRVQLDVVLTGRAVDLVAEGIDLAVRAGRLADSSLIARRVAGSVARLYAAPAYLARRGRPRRIEDLARHDCLLHRASGSSARWTLEGPRGARTVEVRGALSCDELSLLVDGARHGIGIALLPDGAATRAVEEGALVPLLPDWGLGGAALWLVHPPTRHLPRRVAVLRDFLYDELRAQLGT